MAVHEAVMHEQARWENWGEGLWLRSKRWDLCCLTLSGVLVIIPLLLYEMVGSSAMFVNLFVAGVIGGPHMYATFFRTALNPSFRRQHRLILPLSGLIPLCVIGLAWWHFQLLITLFFFWASIHVLHQVAYIVECYERKQPRPLPLWSRAIDYAVVFSCLFPMASYKFIHNEFYIGSTRLLYPEMLKTPLIFYAITAFFTLALLLFVVKTVTEVRQGTVHYPKVLLILTTVGLALLITSYGGKRLEIAFQGFNTWHSFQYLALTWYITLLRSQPSRDESKLMHWLDDTASNRRFRSFYGANIALTLLAIGVIGAVVALTPLSFERAYYIVVLSVLLVHYFHDHVLFTRFDALTRPLPA
jgi:hypothetical protein